MRPYALATCLLLLPAILSAATIHVPADQPTIQAGIDAASAGDTILIACGTYFEHGVDLKGGLTIAGEGSFSNCVILDAQGLGRCITSTEVAPVTSISNITFFRGYAEGELEAHRGGGVYCLNSDLSFSECAFLLNTAVAGVGGGVYCEGSSTIELTNCRFSDNSAYFGAGLFFRNTSSAGIVSNCTFSGNDAYWDAGAIYVHEGSSAHIDHCLFSGNTGLLAPGGRGGAIWCNLNTSAVIENCVFTGNSAHYGGALGVEVESTVTIDRCTLWANESNHNGAISCWDTGQLDIRHSIIAESVASRAVMCWQGGTAVVMCSDIHGNEHGDWTSCIEDQATQNGNISTDPLFCDPDLGDFHLWDHSPCAPANNDCGLMGAWPVGCSTGVEGMTWGRVKALY